MTAKPIKPCIACTILPAAGFFALLVGLSCLTVAAYISRQNTPTASAGGDLVDKAMAIPGSIVLSPHRDLVEMGIFSITYTSEIGDEYDGQIFVCAPGIAVKTPNKWCIWVLGADCIFKVGEHWPRDNWHLKGLPYVDAIGSFNGYQVAYDELAACVRDGNAKQSISLTGPREGMIDNAHLHPIDDRHTTTAAP